MLCKWQHVTSDSTQCFEDWPISLCLHSLLLPSGIALYGCTSVSIHQRQIFKSFFVFVIMNRAVRDVSNPSLGFVYVSKDLIFVWLILRSGTVELHANCNYFCCCYNWDFFSFRIFEELLLLEDPWQTKLFQNSNSVTIIFGEFTLPNSLLSAIMLYFFFSF